MKTAINKQWHAKSIKNSANSNFEITWLKTASLIQRYGNNISFIGNLGNKHPVINMINNLREIFLNLGFDEVINPAIIEDKEVYRQYGPEAPLILDRSYYLAGLRRDDIGIHDIAISKIKRIIPNFNYYSKLQSILRDYKKGLIEGDNLIEVMTLRLNISESQATELINSVFQEYKNLLPKATNLILRSHMTANWFSMLAYKQNKAMPIKLFSIGSRFRKEQRQDSTHLFESTSASLVIMNPNLSMQDGEKLVLLISKKLSLNNLRTVPKQTTSKYYAPGYDWEIYATSNGVEFEIANLGMYSPVSLSNYKIRYPVLNLGFGVERLAMIKSEAKDIRKFVYNGEVA